MYALLFLHVVILSCSKLYLLGTLYDTFINFLKGIEKSISKNFKIP